MVTSGAPAPNAQGQTTRGAITRAYADWAGSHFAGRAPKTCEGWPENAGARLFVSRRTVAWHLHHVFGKFGIRSRGELATALVTRF